MAEPKEKKVSLCQARLPKALSSAPGSLSVPAQGLQTPCFMHPVSSGHGWGWEIIRRINGIWEQHLPKHWGKHLQAGVRSAW